MSGPMRRRSRFPAAPGNRAAESPSRAATGPARGVWLGRDGSLRELVADHATAVGIELIDDPDHVDGTGVAARLVDASSLRETDTSLDTGGAGATPLLVVTSEETVSAETWQYALSAGARAVIELPRDSELLLSHLAELARPRSRSTVIGVAAGHGGAGASSFATRLAAAARPRGAVVLADADPLGGGLDLLVEQPDATGVGWGDLEALGPDDGSALREGLPVVDEVHLLLAGDQPGPEPAALSRALTALASLDGTVIVDLSPSLVTAAAEHLDHLLLVTTASDHAVRAGTRRLRTWPLPPAAVSAVVRRRGPLTPAEVADDLSLPLATSFRDSPSGTVPLLDVRRRGADRAARLLLQHLRDGRAS